MNKKAHIFYSTTLLLTFIVMSVGSTYAYFAASVSSKENPIATSSAKFSLNLSVFPKYPVVENGPYTIIPMKDDLTLKAYKGYEISENNYTPCIDKNNSAVCYIYEIKIFEFSKGIEYVSGSITVKTENINNLKYRLFDDNNNPIILKTDEEGNDIYIDSLPSEEEKNLGIAHDVKNKTETTLYLMIWLSDTGKSQNDTDIGTFTGNVTFSAGKGGQISGTISSIIEGTYTD